MEAYTDFAYVYDTFMDETPYKKWCSFIERTIKKYGISKPVDTEYNESSGDSEKKLESERNLILDLGCGTGTLTQMLADKGYDMIGIDNSPDMLQIAMDKNRDSQHSILYLLQDMRSFELYSTVGTVISVCDSVNYILEEEELVKVFQLVSNYLYPGGIFLFDFNTVYKYEQVIGDTTIAENREECSFIWDNYYHEDEQINEYEVTVFVQEQKNTDIYRKYCETHYQRGYTCEQMVKLVEKAGLSVEFLIDADSKEAVSDKSERVYVLAKSKKGL